MPTAVESRPRPIPAALIPSNPPDLSTKLPKLTPRQRSRPGQRSSSPAPQTPALPRPPQNITFHHPTRRILTTHDHELFLASQTYTLITSFVFNITDSVRGLSISAVSSQTQHPTITSLLDIIASTSQVQQAHPPDHASGSRFGNPEFRTFLAALEPNIATWHKSHFLSIAPGALDELQTYLQSSFGSALRIDYGSGHELNFLIYLLVLNRLALLPEEAFPAVALLVFPAYLELMRNMQGAYYLEPAGSHGVWGLDDYHFLPFLFGASQLADPDSTSSPPSDRHDPYASQRRSGANLGITPLSIHSTPTLEAHSHEYLYLSMVQHVNATKTVQGLRWHSPMLDDISGIKLRDGGWNKVEKGMRKMFVREVLGKLVVMQHFLFGGAVPAVTGMTREDGGDVLVDASDEAVVAATECQDVVVGKEELKRAEGHQGHAHNADSWGDCCGIRVPSAVGAVQEMRKQGVAQGLRRVPFD